MAQSFKKPPFDDSLILPQWIRYNAQHSPEHPLFVYASSPTEIDTITWSKAAQGIERAARIVRDGLSMSGQAINGDHAGDQIRAPQIFGILANIDSITYYTLYLGILRAGNIAFPISTRNSSAAVSQLLRVTGTHKLFVSLDEQTQSLGSSASKNAQQLGHNIDILTIPTFDVLYSNSQNLEPLLDYPPAPVDSPALILHSSGSTAFPKAITLSHRILLEWCKSLEIAGFDLSTQRLAINALPVFHAMGCCMVPWAARTGLILTVFAPQTPPVVPSPSNLLQSAFASQSTFLIAVPLFVELWSREVETVEKLKSFNGIIYSGGPLNKTIGDELWRAGVPLLSFYGATEMGNLTLMQIAPKESTSEWDWISSSPITQLVFQPQEDGSGLFELVCVECHTHHPAILNTEVDGKGAYASNDLVLRHPTDPSKFKVLGRKDDQIMLSSGEKTNPGPIEEIICRNPLVDAAVVFGRGRAQNGIIIQPTKEHQIDPTDPVALAQYRNDIWPSVEQANAFAPSHSRLYKEMILVTHPTRPFERTAKLSPRRAMVLEAYKHEIEAAYNDVQASSQTGVPPPSIWAPTQVLLFVRKLVHSVMGKEVADRDDIFQQGGDSLKATYIRNAIMHALRETHHASASKRISQDFVYENPFIIGLWEQLIAIVDANSKNSGDRLISKLKEVADLTTEFSMDFPKHLPSADTKPMSSDVVLLTGSTGGLGTQLLAHLVSLPNISHIYALNRPSYDSQTSLRARQAEALSERSLDGGIVDSPKVTLVEGDTAIRGFGIKLTLFNEIRDNVTLIIHNAWRVNFRMTLGTFRPMIQGVRNLVDLALQSPQQAPPRFIFTSSVGVFTNWRAQGRPPEAPIDDPKMALSNGYAESKLVGERILENAAKSTPLRPIIVRIGQLTSNSGGVWNSGEWLPAIVRSGQVLGVLPARDDSIAWISLDTAARAIVDIRASSVQYLHIVHPNPAPWSTVFDTFSQLLDVPLVSWSDWLSKLEESNEEQAESNPAIHLLDYFRGCSPVKLENREALGIPLLDLKEALALSPSLADPALPQIGREDAERWVSHWKSTGFLSSNGAKL